MPEPSLRKADGHGSEGGAASIGGGEAREGEDALRLSPALERDLLRHGVKLYGAAWCGMCRNQKALLYHLSPSNWKRMYVDCDFLLNALETSFVRKVPTWKVAGHWYEGAQSAESLQTLLENVGGAKREWRVGGGWEDRRRHHRRAKWAKYDYAIAVRRSVLKARSATTAPAVEKIGNGSVEATAAAIASRRAVLGGRSASGSPKEEAARQKPRQSHQSAKIAAGDGDTVASTTDKLRKLSIEKPKQPTKQPRSNPDTPHPEPHSPPRSDLSPQSVHEFIRDAFRGSPIAHGLTPTKLLSPKHSSYFLSSSFHFPSLSSSTDIMASATSPWSRGPSRLLSNCSWFQHKAEYAAIAKQEASQPRGGRKGQIIKLWTNFADRHCI